jgi:hypothetical protein
MQVSRNAKKKPRREAFFVLIADGEEPTFVDISEHIGKSIPFKKPVATCAMRVSPDVVAFSLLRLTKRSAKQVVDGELSVPRSVLARLERRAPRLALEPNLLQVEILLPSDTQTEADEDALAEDLDTTEAAHATKGEVDTVSWSFTLERDSAGLVDLEAKDHPNTAFALPKGAVKASLYLQSPTAGRTLAVSFIGHLPGKPGAAESPARISALMLNSLTQLAEFRFLAGVEGVRVPPRPNTAWTAKKEQEFKAEVLMPVALFASTEDAAPQARGEVRITADLESARDRLLWHITPSKEIAEIFEATYRPIVTQYVTQRVESGLGPEGLRRAVLDIMLNEVGQNTIDEIIAAMTPLSTGAFFTKDMAAPMG